MTCAAQFRRMTDTEPKRIGATARSMPCRSAAEPGLAALAAGRVSTGPRDGAGSDAAPDGDPADHLSRAAAAHGARPGRHARRHQAGHHAGARHDGRAEAGDRAIATRRDRRNVLIKRTVDGALFLERFGDRHHRPRAETELADCDPLDRRLNAYRPISPTCACRARSRRRVSSRAARRASSRRSPICARGPTPDARHRHAAADRRDGARSSTSADGWAWVQGRRATAMSAMCRPSGAVATQCAGADPSSSPRRAPSSIPAPI